MDWEQAKNYLDQVRDNYTSIGVAGMMALNHVINPLLIRYENGERTEELFIDIMNLD